MKKSLLIAVFFLYTISTALPAHAAEKSTLSFGTDTPIEVEADSVEYFIEKKEYLIKGNATMTSGDSTLIADTITINTETEKAHASGNAVIVTADETINAKEFTLDLKTRFGTVMSGRIFVKSENFYITGDSLERTGERTYIVKNGTFTTCDGDVPAWKFSASHLDIEIDGYVFAYHPVFYVKDVPSFYLPAIVFPIKKTRQSGFLFPELGHSSDDGNIVKLPYYQVISDSMDATFTLDSRSKFGIGLDTEYRYVLGEQSFGDMHYFIMDEYSRVVDRWSYNLRHSEYFSPTASLKVDLTTLSDRNFYKDISESEDERNKEKIESNVTFTKNFDNALIQIEHSFDKDLIYNEPLGDLSNSNTQFPKLTASLYNTRIKNTPLNYSGVLTFNNYIQKRYDNFTYLKADPKISADFTLGRYAVFTPYFASEHARFWLHDDATRAGDTHDSYSTGAILSSKVMRIFSPGSTFKIRHSINPELEYLYVPRVDVYETFYTKAEIKDETNELTLRLINRLTTRRDEGSGLLYAEPVRLELSQTYDINEAERDLDPAVTDDERRPLKPLFVDLDVIISDYLTFGGELYHDHYMEDHIRQSNASLTLKDNREDYLEAKYTYLKDVDDYLESYVNINLSHGVHVNNKLRYDFIENETLENTFGLRFAMQCWEMILTYSKERIEDLTDPLNPDSYIEESVFLYVSLKGVGETKNIALNE